MKKFDSQLWGLVILLASPFWIGVPVMYYLMPEVQNHVNVEVLLWYSTLGWSIVGVTAVVKMVKYFKEDSHE